MGFGVPMDTWLRGPLRAWADDLLGPGRLDREAYLDSRIVGKAWADHRDGRRNNAHSLWCALMFESWLAATHA
jgi:asparagine synthase (glutamine-hydrolysing)